MNTITNLRNNWMSLLPGLGLVFLSAGAAQAQSIPATPNIIWTGAVDNFYAKPGNWNLGRVPNSTDNVLIPLTANQPVLNSGGLGLGTAGTLNIGQNASLTLNAQSELDLYGDLNLASNASFGSAGLLSVRSLTPTSTNHAITSTGGTVNPITINDLETLTNAPTSLVNVPVRLIRSLTLTANLTTAATGGTLTLLSTPASTAFIVNNGGIVNGVATIQRAIDNSVNTGLGYRHYSTPVSGNTVSDFSTATFTPVLTTSYNESTFAPGTRPFPTVETYDQTRVTTDNGYGNFDRGFFIPSSASTPLVVGRGYTVNLGGSELVDFVGTPNNGPVTVMNVTRNAANTTAAGDAGWQFLGNPYPSAIDWSRPAAVTQRAAAGLDDGMYVYTSTSQYGGYYRAYAGGSGNPVIPLGQGFFVRKTNPGTTQFVFNNDFRLTTSDGTTFQRSVANVRPQLEMALYNGDKVVQDMLNVYFDNGSTAGVDLKDALKMPNNNGMFLGTLTADGQELAIDGRPVPTDKLIIPLHVAVSASGAYTLKPTMLNNLSDLHVYLHDKRLGSFTDLSQQPEYTFNLNSVNPAARFELVFSKQPITEVAPAALTQQVMLYPSPAKGVVYLELPTSLGSETVKTTLLDGMGRTVRTTSLEAEGEATHQVDLQGLRSGIYVLQLHTSAGIVAKRLVVE